MRGAGIADGVLPMRICSTSPLTQGPLVLAVVFLSVMQELQVGNRILYLNFVLLKF
jgi:hypothetical protein